MHIVLLGDSVFDNAAYTRGEPDVVSHLRALLPHGAHATLCALDGATSSSLGAQLSRVPSGATELVLSVGGNEALGDIDLLDLPARSTAEALAAFEVRVRRFERAYGAALEGVLALSIPLTLCTIYNGNLPDPAGPPARLALRLYNDFILRSAFTRGLRVIDLRAVCSDPADYANLIEPSGTGGRKIAQAILRALQLAPEPLSPCRVHV